MYLPKTPYTEIALQSLTFYLSHRTLKGLILTGIPSELYKQKRACFVSLHKLNGDLRGCIGTIEPKEENIVLEISCNAISAAMNDSRFTPLRYNEMENIELSVDVLSKPEPISNINDLDPDIFGVIVSDGGVKRAVLLPGLEGIGTIEKQLRVVKRKAGLSDISDEYLTIHRFTSTRYR
jgi:AmmeMemoRadiSam system protein A